MNHKKELLRGLWVGSYCRLGALGLQGDGLYHLRLKIRVLCLAPVSLASQAVELSKVQGLRDLGLGVQEFRV